MFDKLIRAALGKVCLIYVHAQACPLVHRGLSFLWKEWLVVIFYLLLLTCLLFAVYTQKHKNIMHLLLLLLCQLVNQFLRFLVGSTTFSWLKGTTINPYPCGLSRYFSDVVAVERSSFGKQLVRLLHSCFSFLLKDCTPSIPVLWSHIKNHAIPKHLHL
jgi:hypothetical protein